MTTANIVTMARDHQWLLTGSTIHYANANGHGHNTEFELEWGPGGWGRRIFSHFLRFNAYMLVCGCLACRLPMSPVKAATGMLGRCLGQFGNCIEQSNRDGVETKKKKTRKFKMSNVKCQVTMLIRFEMTFELIYQSPFEKSILKKYI